jgi:hypothetical protein
VRENLTIQQYFQVSGQMRHLWELVWLSMTPTPHNTALCRFVPTIREVFFILPLGCCWWPLRRGSCGLMYTVTLGLCHGPAPPPSPPLIFSGLWFATAFLLIAVYTHCCCVFGDENALWGACFTQCVLRSLPVLNLSVGPTPCSAARCVSRVAGVALLCSVHKRN